YMIKILGTITASLLLELLPPEIFILFISKISLRRKTSFCKSVVFIRGLILAPELSLPRFISELSLLAGLQYITRIVAYSASCVILANCPPKVLSAGQAEPSFYEHLYYLYIHN
ncbi:hypothetical protein L9F63_013920, partial [Diploptera punctata]